MSDISTSVETLKISKANRLVEQGIVTSEKKLSLRDQKIILAIIGQISPEDEDFKDYKLSIKEVVELTGINRSDLYRELHDICLRLTTCGITVKEPQNPKGFLVSTWFSSAEYLPDENCVCFSVSPKLKPYLLKLKCNFTTYSFAQVMSLKSSYSIRMYEILRQFYTLKDVRQGKKTGFREISIDVLRDYLGVSGDRYSRFAEFNRNVIKKAKVELEENTDICFECEPIKLGRKITGLKFIISENRSDTENKPDKGAVREENVKPAEETGEKIDMESFVKRVNDALAESPVPAWFSTEMAMELWEQYDHPRVAMVMKIIYKDWMSTETKHNTPKK